MGILRLAALFGIVPGASHLSLQAYSHFGIYFYLGSFVAIGIIQIILGFRVWRGELSERAFWACTLINGIATVFWILTRMIYAPFMGGVEHFSILGVTVGSLQILFIAILCWRRGSVRDTVIVIVLSLALGFAAHAGAVLTERVFPALKGTGTHSHGGGADAHDDSAMPHGDDGHDDDEMMHEDDGHVDGDGHHSDENEGISADKDIAPDPAQVQAPTDLTDADKEVVTKEKDDHVDGEDDEPHGH